jgi:hypothetical protein
MPKRPTKADSPGPRCGLCGKKKNLIRTECCGNWICDDVHEYVTFSYAHNSCYRNHDRSTLCASHFHEGHSGDWKTCKRCKTMFETEMYVWYGTNEYNFEILKDPPAFTPTNCSKCGKVINLGTDGHTRSGKEYWCERCASKEFQKQFPRIKH